MKKKVLIGIIVFCVIVIGGLAVRRIIIGDESDKLIGTWKVEIKHENLGNGFNFSLKNPALEYVDYSEVDKAITYTFEENGIYSIKIDVEEYINEFSEAIESGVTKYYEKLIEDEGLNISVEEYMYYIGDSFDSYIDKDSIEKLRNDEGQTIKGKYKLQNDKLYLTDDVDKEPITKDNPYYQAITLDGDTLTIYKPNNNENIYLISNGFYPLTLTKE